MSRSPLLILCLLLSGAAGCTKKTPVEIGVKPGQVWNVYKGDRKVLIVKNEPGPISSTALPEPGAWPQQHRFLTGSARYAPEEGSLRNALEQSKSFEEFLKHLQERGYRLEPEP